MIIGIVAVALGIVAIALVLGLAAVKRAKSSYEGQQELTPGRSGVVPVGWVGSHDSEAVMHRRLVAALAAVRAGGQENMDLVTRAVAVEHELLLAAQRPLELRPDALEALQPLVDRIEVVAYRIAGREHAHTELAADMADLEERVNLVAQAHEDLGGSATFG